ncbi:hypothetical protein HLH44_19875 [Gluconacetobacter sp. 1c LMG 22058]|uniref:Uncharacterized protein n=1 Tax=Gluconacetobacter dulcium TaxID=2729096 RepID=A0A7W4PJD2_9PROT|nr:hypothetical protein [Gluconacetobacter dulcium]MBB2199658.1 hypothetical protein [Gluconacetobacter dulcium]
MADNQTTEAQSESIDLCDALSHYNRSIRHQEELWNLLESNSINNLWTIQCRIDQSSRNYIYALLFNKHTLTLSKPIISDAANNLISALDHVAAAIAKARGRPRARQLYFPLAINDDDFEKYLERPTEELGADAVKIIDRLRKKHKLLLPSMQAIRKIANSGKHWELMPVSASCFAVSVIGGDGKPVNINVPEDAFLNHEPYDFYSSNDPINNNDVTIDLSMQIIGLPDEMSGTPRNMFSEANQFVLDVIDEMGIYYNWNNDNHAER